jgi:LmbE family N-acetylglucosaminyl deacetylase
MSTTTVSTRRAKPWRPRRDRLVTVLDQTPARAMAIFAHPDDPEVACAGTLHTWADAGAEVELVIANAGEKGVVPQGMDPAGLAAVREEEARRAAKVLGIAVLHFLGHPDGDLENTSALRADLIRLLRAARPDVVIAPDPTAVFFGDSYVNHHDHRALGWAVLDVAGAMAGGALYEPEAGPPHQLTTLLLAGTLEPDTWVDIELALDAKLTALRCHESQVGDGAEVVADLVEARAAEAGQQAGLRYAEGFRRLSFGPR